MALIEMGIDFSAAQKEAEEAMKPAPNGVYTLQVLDCEMGHTQKGQLRGRWTLQITDSPNPEDNGKKISHFTNFPDNGDLTGVGYLTQFLSAIGNPWTGSDFDTDTCKGLTCRANVGISDDGKWNQIESFV